MHNAKLSQYAKKLRREMTKEECHLWYDFLKDIPEMVHRQKVIGPYIVDFYVASAKLVIELDGAQHFENEHSLKDVQRDAYLQRQGITVLRYPNNDVNCRFAAVCEDILNHLPNQPSP